jgi:hypothetical protein
MPADIEARYSVREWRNAIAVLRTEFPAEWASLLEVLRAFRLCKSALEVPGGNKTLIAGALDTHFTQLGFRETRFDTRVTVVRHSAGDPEEQFEYDSPTHKVDSYKNFVGIEVEWNNKDTFYDRDLNNFRLLFELRVLGVGVIITRGEDIRQLAIDLGRSPGTYGATTTHWSTLIPRMEGNGGGGCPVLAIGITRETYDATC